jgi:SAM-dependent methyltransferase
MSDEPKAGLAIGLREWWKESLVHRGFLRTLKAFLGSVLSFLRDSTPARRRQRYGDVEYDWDYRVDTTSATVGWRDRLLGLLHSPYQPSEPALFREMLTSVQVDYREFIFVDVGSGKGRALLMAADYPFRRVLGVELLPELNRVARNNLCRYKSSAQKCFNIESVCAAAQTFVFPPEPTLLYLFNPLQESELEQLLKNLERSLKEFPRKVFVLYHNPALEHVLSRVAWLQKLGGTHRYCAFASRCKQPR